MNRGYPSRVRVGLIVAGLVTVLLAALEVLGDHRAHLPRPGDVTWDSPAIADGLAGLGEIVAEGVNRPGQRVDAAGLMGPAP
jgi:hypothetical protein